MTHERIIEDRVFGRPEEYPVLPIVTKPSAAFDLLSVNVEGADVAYAQQGTVNHPPLVFLHGWGASHRFWRWSFSAFAPRYRCIAPDLVGFGHSEKPKRVYSIEAYSPWLGRFLDILGHSRVTLVGHSMGGSIALKFAIDHPERVERLIVVNPLIHGPSAFSRRTRLLMLPGVRALAFAMLRSDSLRPWVIRDFTYVAPLEDDLALDVTRATYGSAIGSMLSCMKLDLTSQLSSLRVPTLTVGTDHDRIIIMRQYELVPAARKALISNSGHIPLIERPAEFNALLDSFLRS